ncbi:MAG TPA: MarR family winged helix-turn-helix transcriptional regulator [Sphingomicrobium sp.]
MDMYLSANQNRANPYDPHPVLVVGDTEGARTRARQTVMMAGLRVTEIADGAAACPRVDEQPAASALWIELDGGAPPSLEALLDDTADKASRARFPTIVAAPSRLLDDLAVYAFNSDIELLIDASDGQRLAALSLAASGAFTPASAAEASADKNAARLRQLSDEVSRIAATLARLSTGPAASPRPAEPVGDAPDVSAETVRAIIRARRLRGRYFPAELFADPAWDMLLDLLQAEISKLRVPVSSLCIAAAVPATTALRWLKSMVQEGIFIRREDPHDGRRVFVELAPATSQALRRYFAEVGAVAVV